MDGDGSFIMNVQDLATIKAENLSVKFVEACGIPAARVTNQKIDVRAAI
ncbi:hypothetical protein WN943_029232 [Citrus x changshan-huyou]